LGAQNLEELNEAKRKEIESEGISRESEFKRGGERSLLFEGHLTDQQTGRLTYLSAKVRPKKKVFAERGVKEKR